MIRLSGSALLLSSLSLLLLLTAACGASGLEGTYSTSAGNVVLELRSGGKSRYGGQYQKADSNEQGTQ